MEPDPSAFHVGAHEIIVCGVTGLRCMAENVMFLACDDIVRWRELCVNLGPWEGGEKGINW